MKEPTIFLNAKTILKDLGVSHGQTVMDLGCGSGYFVIEASRLVGDPGTFYAVDVLKPSLSTVSSKAATYGLTNIKTIWSDAEVVGGAHSVMNASVDVMLLIQLFSQTNRHQDVFREAARMTKPNGQIVVIDWQPDRMQYGPPKERRLPIENIKAMATKEGWSHFKEIKIGAYHFGLVITK